jgi:hypothetical protein
LDAVGLIEGGQGQSPITECGFCRRIQTLISGPVPNSPKRELLLNRLAQ